MAADTWTVLVMTNGKWRTWHQSTSFYRAVESWNATPGLKRFQRNGRSLPINSITDQPDLFQEAS